MVATQRVPVPREPGVVFSARAIRGLYVGSLRSSATKSKTSSTGRWMSVDPVIATMSPASGPPP